MQILSLSLMTYMLCAADLPNPDSLPASKDMPDPLVMLDGSRVMTAEEWQTKRRPELKTLLQHYMYGYLPPKAKGEGKLLREDKKAQGGKATLKEILLHIGDVKAPPIHVLLVVPNHRSGPAPVFVG